MPTATRTADGVFTDSNWTGGSGTGGVPAAGDDIVFAAPYQCGIDTDLSGYGNITVQGSNSTPAMIYFKNSVSGRIALAANKNIAGTSGTNKGRILANYDGVWRGIFGLEFTVNTTTGVCTTSTAHQFTDGMPICFYAQLGNTLPAPLDMGVTYYARDCDTYTFKVAATSGGSAITFTTSGTGTFYVNSVIPFASKGVINCNATSSKVDAQYLDVSMNCYEPTVKWVRTYGTAYQFTSTAVDVDNNTIDLGTTPPTEGTVVKVTVTSTALGVSGGTLPNPLNEVRSYYVRGVSGTKCKLAYSNSDSDLVDLTTQGSGTIVLYTGYSSGSATVKVLDDVTGVTGWTTTSGHNRVVLVNASTSDTQKLTMTTINAGSIVLSENVDSTQYAGALLVLSSRNVSIQSATTTSNQYIVDYSNNPAGSGCFGCEITSTGGTSVQRYGYAVYTGIGHICSVITSTNVNYMMARSCILLISAGVDKGMGYVTNSVVLYSLGGQHGIHYAQNSYGYYVMGAYSAIYASSSCFVDTAVFCSTCISGSTSCQVGTAIQCTTLIGYSSADLYNCQLQSITTECAMSYQEGFVARSFKHNGVENDTRAWSCGGTMTHDTSVYPTGKTYSHKFTYTSSAYRALMFWRIPSVVGNQLRIPVFAKHDSTGLTALQRLTFALYEDKGNPLFFLYDTPVVSWTASDSTDWQSTLLQYTRTSQYPMILAVFAKRGSGNAYCYIEGGDRGKGLIFR